MPGTAVISGAPPVARVVDAGTADALAAHHLAPTMHPDEVGFAARVMAAGPMPPSASDLAGGR